MRKKISIVVGILSILILTYLISGIFTNILAENNDHNSGTRQSSDILEAEFGSLVTIDGTISDNEWSDANSIELDNDLNIDSI